MGPGSGRKINSKTCLRLWWLNCFGGNGVDRGGSKGAKHPCRAKLLYCQKTSGLVGN